MATPDAAKFVIGDQRGNVHILPANVGPEALLEKAQDLSFFGHNTEVRTLEVSNDGSLAASTADDNSLRVWNIADGLPRKFIGSIQGEPIERLAFSPDASMLGVLNGHSATVIDTASGKLLARFELGERHKSLAFADSDHLYVGSESGAFARDIAASCRRLEPADSVAGRLSHPLARSISKFAAAGAR